MNKLTLLVTLLFSAQSFAATALPKSIKCDNGHLEDDRLFRVQVDKSGLTLTFWEAQLVAKRTDLVHSGNTIAIVEKVLKGEAEGEKFTPKVSALFVFNPKTKVLTSTVHLDGSVGRSAEKLKCR